MSAGSARVSRRTFLQWTALGTAGAALAACAPAAPASSSAAGGDAAAAPGSETATVAFWLTGGQQWDDFYNKTIFPQFYEVHPEIKMETTILGSWTDLYNKLVTSAAGGAPPELARQKDFFTPDFAVRGIMQPLDDYAVTSEHITADAYLPLAWENAHWDGKLVAMPLHIFIHYLHMSNELFEGAGLMNDDGTPQVPDDWEQLREVARAITRPDEGIYGMMLRDYGGEEDTVNFFHVMLAQAGGQLIDENYETFLFNSEAGLDALTFQVELIQEGLCLPPGTSTEWGDREQQGRHLVACRQLLGCVLEQQPRLSMVYGHQSPAGDARRGAARQPFGDVCGSQAEGRGLDVRGLCHDAGYRLSLCPDRELLYGACGKLGKAHV